jgi:DNA helicase HerA-like ATPase
VTQKIKIGEVEGKPIYVDIDKFIETRGVIQGTSGSGKSGLIRVICERISKHVPVIVLDREGEFATLREKIDMVLVGANGDIPTDLRSAEILARKLVELRVSAVIDLYDLKIQQQREYVKRFCEALVNLPKEGLR